MSSSLDLLISGAGVVGGALACALAPRGLQIGLVDPQGGENRQADGRFYAISYGSVSDLRTWGIWEKIEKEAVPIRIIRTTQRGGGRGLTYQASEMGVDALGYMIPSHLLQQAVYQGIKAFPNVVSWIPNSLSRWMSDSTGVQVTLEKGDSLKARLLVGADGRFSRLREVMGGSTVKYPYNQVALVLTVAHTEEHEETAFEHFTPDGPLAFLPLPQKRSAVVWSLSPERAQALAQDPHLLLHALIHHFGWGLGDLELASPIYTYPLHLVMPHHTWGKRIALVGDAAHVIHPLAGQGLNIGLRDVASLAQAISQSHSLGLDIGSETMLKTWGQKRRLDQWSMAALTHGLVSSFQLNNSLLNRVAALGFWGVEQCAPLKKRLTRHAMGVHS